MEPVDGLGAGEGIFGGIVAEIFAHRIPPDVCLEGGGCGT